ncbi:hypothetical protein [Streptomyces sp. NPDC057107]|uniref:hypothetical protein n=1 Tax=Streptomyces sp. NPDC057107 TaxID=3346021 RepID=UPI00124A5064
MSDGEAEGIRGSPMAKALDDEGHERRRWMAGRGFTARWAATLEPGMEAVADRMADGMPDHGSPAELVDSLPTSFRRNPTLRAAEEGTSSPSSTTRSSMVCARCPSSGGGAGVLPYGRTGRAPGARTGACGSVAFRRLLQLDVCMRAVTSFR